jgi:anti-sigma B factor antagonist
MSRPSWWPRRRSSGHGTETVIIIEGEFDLSGVPRFRACVREALETHPGLITVDARALRFVDSTGLAALLRARAVADKAGVAFRLREPSPELRRIAEIAGIHYLLTDE